MLGTRICVSATLADKVKDFRGRPIGDLVLRGKTSRSVHSSPLALNNTTIPRPRAI
jgi:adenylate cyclase